jgi:glycosyltransferase involved in cell wall biosynthesis
MRLRIIDYVANPGGGLRFAIEAVRGLAAAGGLTLEVVSHGRALRAYERGFEGRVDARLMDVPPANSRSVRGRRFCALPIVGPMARGLGLGLTFHYEVPAAALKGADLVWFPWLHSHRLPVGSGRNVVGSLHDLILLDYPQHFGRYIATSEGETISGWIGSDARIVASSNATVAALGARFGTATSRFDVVPLSGEHRAAAELAHGTPRWDFEQGAYLLCPANIAPHKNHEVLLDALARLGRRLPLVLTGPGTELRSVIGRSGALRGRLRSSGLTLGKDVIGLGYLDDADYYRLLSGARCLVMPTLAEGGGSFPVWEALFEGVPVICSDIPVLREMAARAGASVTWFDPGDPADLAARLDELMADPDAARVAARAQVERLNGRSWNRVAQEYAQIFAGAGGPRPSATEREGAAR